MKALVLAAANVPFSLETRPDPTPGAGEAVARVLACGAGLTVQHVKAGRIPVRFPRIVGHEITGEIVAVGTGVTDLAAGVPVTAYSTRANVRAPPRRPIPCRPTLRGS